MTKEEIINLVNEAIDETLESVSVYVNEWVDSSQKDQQKEIESLKEEFRVKIENKFKLPF